MAAYSERVLDHFKHPRNSGELESATHRAEVTNPVCGDVLKLAARIENEQILEARFLCRGCTTAIASASILCERVSGMAVRDALRINGQWVSEALGELPAETMHGAHLAADALKLLLKNG